MAVYTYVAKDDKGVMLTGTYTDVESQSALRDELEKIGYVSGQSQAWKTGR